MKKGKVIKIVTAIFVVVLIVAGTVAYNFYFMEHRNAQNEKVDYAVSEIELVKEYLADASSANAKYLSETGDSKILEVTGIVSKINMDFVGNTVVLLKSEANTAGVSCTFTENTNNNAATISTGDNIVVKGVIRAGASYDEDLGMYENVIMEQCAIVTK